MAQHPLSPRLGAGLIILAAFSLPALAAEPKGQPAPVEAPKAEAPKSLTPGLAPHSPHGSVAPGKGGKVETAKAQPTPDSPGDRSKMLGDLYAHLATAANEEQSKPVVEAIERLWLYSGSDTINLLMERALRAVAEKRQELALKLLDAVTELAPDFAEGWNRRAYVYYTQNDYERAMGDLRRVLALEPSHFKAMDGLAQIFKETGNKKGALKAYKELMQIYPSSPGVEDSIKELSREVEGQGI